MYTQNDLVRIAKRENNNKRGYLVVDPLQGKHVPVRPAQALELFEDLGEVVKNHYQKERLLIVGFAETATAIGAAVAVANKSYYMQTTREVVEGVHYLFFSEAHSHATEQKLIREDLESVLPDIDRILFVEDEVTTGNTILNIVKLIRREYPGSAEFAVASLLNGMDTEAQQCYTEQNIPVHYLVKTSHSEFEAAAELVRGDGVYHKPGKDISYSLLTCEGYQNARRLVRGEGYGQACEELWQQVKDSTDVSGRQRMLVLGTEEFMYPALYVAGKLEEMGKDVLFHATTRSPIVVSTSSEYPLHSRYELVSAYEDTRTTFVYGLAGYDLVLVITDAAGGRGSGLDSISAALHMAGSENITVIRWCG